MGVRGPKGYGEELRIKQRYSDLSEKAFKFLAECLDGEDKIDKKWAVEQLSKGLVKMIPQDLTTNGEKITMQIINYADNHDTAPIQPPSLSA
jgi:predicted nucleic acid-binding protein